LSIIVVLGCIKSSLDLQSNLVDSRAFVLRLDNQYIVLTSPLPPFSFKQMNKISSYCLWFIHRNWWQKNPAQVLSLGWFILDAPWRWPSSPLHLDNFLQQQVLPYPTIQLQLILVYMHVQSICNFNK
jgi:hypothetical protein